MNGIAGQSSRLRQPFSGNKESRPSLKPGIYLDGPARPTFSREYSASKFPEFRREASMPQIKRELSIPKIRREKSDIPTNPWLKTPSKLPGVSETQVITPEILESPKTVAVRKVAQRNISAKGTRSGVSGVSEKIMIGDRVLIKATGKKGMVLFVGGTKFAKGICAGIVLDEPTGKNDGSVGGVRYFSCPKLHGIFVKEDKLEKLADSRGPGFSPYKQRNSSSKPDKKVVNEGQDFVLGDRVVISSTSGLKEGTLRYMGETRFAKGIWCGVELDDTSGKNDGSVAGTRYFRCESQHGIFSKIHKVKKLNSNNKPEIDLTPSKQSINTSSNNNRPLKKSTPSLSNNIPLAPSEVIQPQEDIEQDEFDKIEKAIELAALHDDILSDKTASQDDIEKIAALEKAHDEQQQKIALLELQLSKRDEEVQKLLEGESKLIPTISEDLVDST